jgi:MFS family permease
VLRDRPYAVLTVLNAVMLLYMPLLSLVIPLWIAAATSAPTWTAAAVLALNTLSVMLFQVRVARRVTDVPSAARTVRIAGLVMLVACGVFATTARTASPWLTCAALATAALLQVLAEMLQAAGSWELSFGLAPSGRHGLYQGMYASGIPLARVLGPAALTGLILGYGAAGWLVLGALIAAAALTTVPVTRWALATRTRFEPGSNDTVGGVEPVAQSRFVDSSVVPLIGADAKEVGTRNQHPAGDAT